MVVNPFTVYFVIFPGLGILLIVALGLAVMWTEKRAKESEEFKRKYEKFQDFNVRMLPTSKTKERLVAVAFVVFVIYALIYGFE